MPPIWDRQPKAPDGSPLSEWDAFTFTPNKDMTAYELAILLKHFMRDADGSLTFEQPFYFPKDRTKALANFPEFHDIERHFTKANSHG